MIPSNSLYLWPDGKTYTCYIWTTPEKAERYIIDIEVAQAVYPREKAREAVRMLAMDRFTRSTD